MQAASTIHRGL